MTHTPLTIADVVDIVHRHIRYDRPGYAIQAELDPETGLPYIEVLHYRPDTVTGEYSWGGGGKRYISKTATRSDVVRIVFGALVAYEEHEVREFFLLDGYRVFGPHNELLPELAEDGAP